MPRFKPFKPVLVAALLPVLLSACAGLKPVVKSPDSVSPFQLGEVPASFKNSNATASQPRASGAPSFEITAQWWRVFQDETLNTLQSQLLVGNQTIQVSQAQLAQVSAALSASERASRPTLNASAGSSRSASPSGTTSSFAINPSNNQSLNLQGSWEIDLWGRLSSANLAAQQNQQASAADLAAVRLSAQAALNQTYFALRTSEAQMALLTRSIAQYERALALTRIRFEGGVSPKSDTLQAQIQLNNAQSQWQTYAQQRRQQEHAIAVLLGLAPSAFSLPETGVLPAVLAAPSAVPSDLLSRRPDLAAARHKIGAALAQQGVAQAAFFPSIVLSASTGFRNSSLANLISAPSLLWSLGASVAQSLLDSGQRQQAKEQAAASVDANTAAYRQQVLVALQEVEDQLSLSQSLTSEAQLQNQSLTLAEQNAVIVAEQYKAGTVNYLNVTTSNITVLNAQSNALTIQSRQLAALNALLKNVAGRWE